MGHLGRPARPYPRATSPDDWAAVARLFDAAIDLGHDDRRTLLETSCAGRPTLRAEVESLLDADAAAETLLPLGGVATLFPELQLGNTIGALRLAEVIGVGGMSTVYRAERADRSAAPIAVKLMAVRAGDPAAVRRFHGERRILASLRHPHIVTLLGGGVTDWGQEFLAMEYVDGPTLTSYCRRHSLSLESRLRLFRDLCSAVIHAHRQRVVHRDIKPDNILVTPDGVPKLLDFGIAQRLDDPELTPAAPWREVGPLTPDYASPEQLLGLPATPSSDVYALGVLLYELAAGVRPYETSGRCLEGVLRLLSETEPPPPSAARPSADACLPYEPCRRLGGTMDGIILKAMSKAPELRYGTVAALSEDVGRHLEALHSPCRTNPAQ